MCVSGSFDSQFVHLIKSTVNNFGVYSSAVVILVYSSLKCRKIIQILSVKRVRLVILTRKGILIVARVLLR